MSTLVEHHLNRVEKIINNTDGVVTNALKNIDNIILKENRKFIYQTADNFSYHIIMDLATLYKRKFLNEHFESDIILKLKHEGNHYEIGILYTPDYQSYIERVNINVSEGFDYIDLNYLLESLRTSIPPRETWSAVTINEFIL